MLTDPKLSLFTGEEEDVCEGDERPQHKITNYAIYDKLGHLCDFDSGLIEKNKELYFSGYVKPIYDENSGIEGAWYHIFLTICPKAVLKLVEIGNGALAPSKSLSMGL